MALTRPSARMLSEGSGLVLATPQTPSGVALAEFTGIPAGVRQVIVMLHRISFATGSENPAIQLGHAGGYTTSGYNAGYGGISTNTAAQGDVDTGIIFGAQGGAAQTYSGQITFTLLDPTNHVWSWHGSVYSADGSSEYLFYVGGSVDMAGELTKLKLYGWLNGYNLDAGTINIAYK